MRQLALRMGVRDEELEPLAAGCVGFGAALAGYFLLLPLRDEAGVSLGTDKLPRLFIASLLLTFVATPPLAAALNRSHARERGLQLLFRMLSLSVLGFVLLYTVAGSPPAPVPPEHQASDALGDATGAHAEQRHVHVAPGAAQLTTAQAAVRVAFFLWVSLLNLVAVSSLWARSADVFSPEAAGRLFGLLGAGATLGQLLGSLVARALARAQVLGGGAAAPSLLPLVASAGMLELAGQAARRYRLVRPLAAAAEAAALSAVEAGKRGSPGAAGSAKGLAAGASGRGSSSRALGDGLRELLVGQALEGYRMIRASPFLLHIVAYLGLNYATSSLFYFEKSLVVARVPDAAARTAWFATINSVSAFAILVLQVLATGKLLQRLGLATALAVLPSAAGLLMVGIALRPTPATVAAAEVCRKVLAYSLARPARETLFTVVSREEKYRAKIFLDTVVQRVGDASAAAIFQVLIAALGFGPSLLAAAAVPVCGCWAVVAHRLGLRQQRLAAARPLAL